MSKSKFNLYTASDIRGIKGSNHHDTVKERLQQNNHRYDLDLLTEAENSFLSKENFRKNRERCLRYVFGDQWSDLVEVNGTTMVESKLISRQGNIPLKNNVMFPLYFSIVGLHAKQETEPVAYARKQEFARYAEMMSSALQTNWQNSDMPVLMDSIVGELICSGAGFTREKWVPDSKKIYDAETEYCNPYFMFWECGSDPRNNDFTMIGLLHDLTKEQLYERFAKKEFGLNIDKLDALYNTKSSITNQWAGEAEDKTEYEHVNFYTPAKENMCRVIEVWKEEVKERYQIYDPLADTPGKMYFRIEMYDHKRIAKLIEENKHRNEMYDAAGVPEEERLLIQYEAKADTYWHYEYLTPTGFVLCEGESPFYFKEHPFTACFYPYPNAKIVPYLSMVIDQQRYINRTITMHDMAARSAIKGWKLLPLSLKPAGMTEEEYRDSATDFDAVLIYDDTKNPGGKAKPEMISPTISNLGFNEILQTELNLVHEISGVQSALQGKAPVAGTSGALYNLQAQNATTTLYGLMKRFGSFKESVAQKKCEMIQQYYDDGRGVSKPNADKDMYFDSAVRDMAFRASIKESQSSASMAQAVDQFLQQLYQMQVIDAKQLVKYSTNLPHRDEILQEMDQRENMMQQGQMAQQPIQVPGADQGKVAALENIMNNYDYKLYQRNGNGNAA